MLTTGVRVPPRTAGQLRATSPAHHRLPGFPATTSLIQSRHRVQTRSVRLDRGYSYSSRHRYKHISSCMNRALAWHQHQNIEDPRAILKRLMARYWDASTSWPTGRYADVDKIKSWSDELSGVRPGRNIEDVERSAINHLFGHSDPSTSPGGVSVSHPFEYNPRQSPLQNIRNTFNAQGIAETHLNQAGVQVDSAAIDPITNRRVSRQTLSEAEKPITEQTKSRQVSRAHYTLPESLRTEPIHSNGPPSAEELQQYNQVTIDDKPWQPSEAESRPYSDLEKYKPVVDEIPAADSTSTAPLYDDLAEYKPTDFTHSLDAASATETEPKYDDLPKYGPVMWKEPDGLPPLSAEERSKLYTDLESYGPIRWREPDGLPQPTAEELSKNYDDLHEYNGPYYFNEPDGKLPPTAEELSKRYDDLHKYDGPYHFNEPHGKLPPSSEELSKQYTDLHKYSGPFHWNEPDGLPPLTAEERSKMYTDLYKYGGPFSWNEPDGLPAPTAEELSKKYTDFRRYGPLSWHEPDGKTATTAEVAASKQYTDLDEYGKVEWNEPDGKPTPTAEEKSKQYTDLDKYGKVEWNEPDGKPAPTPEEKSKKYTDLGKYSKVEWNEPDGQPAPTGEERSKQYTDLDKYGKVEWKEPDGKPTPTAEETSKKYTDLDKYGKVEWNEPDRKPAPTAEESSKQYTDLNRYTKVEWNEPDGRPAPSAEETSKVYGDLDKYGKAEWNEPDGKAAPTAEEVSKRYTDLHNYGKVEWNEPDGKPPMNPEEASKQYTDLHRYAQPFRHEPSEEAQELDALRPSDIRAKMVYKMTGSPLAGSVSESLENDMSDHARAWDNASKVAKATVQQAKIRASKMETDRKDRQLTGNYVRDFPEDFQVSWSPLLGQDATAGQAGDKQSSVTGTEVDIASLDESFPTLETTPHLQATSTGSNETAGTPKLEPALNRVAFANWAQKRADRSSAQINPHAEEQQGFELSYMEECAAGKETSKGDDSNAVKQNSVKAEGSGPQSEQEPHSEKTKLNEDTSGKQTKEPSQYKILAYDPALETITTAETTSTVTDTMKPAPPPEVLQRLSNPVKFFPYLEGLEEEGYEMISGSGNMLIFRKVRDGKPPCSHTRLQQQLKYRPSHVNPIDMMGRQPVTPHPFSASPTGYVGYETDMAEVDHKPPPPFRSRTGAEKVRTADELTGSARTESGGSTGKGSRRGKKIVLGALGVGGVSYTVGLLGEYFRTGGADGAGQPTRV